MGVYKALGTATLVGYIGLNLLSCASTDNKVNEWTMKDIRRYTATLREQNGAGRLALERIKITREEETKIAEIVKAEEAKIAETVKTEAEKTQKVEAELDILKNRPLSYPARETDQSPLMRYPTEEPEDSRRFPFLRLGLGLAGIALALAGYLGLDDKITARGAATPTDAV